MLGNVYITFKKRTWIVWHSWIVRLLPDQDLQSRCGNLLRNNAALNLRIYLLILNYVNGQNKKSFSPLPRVRHCENLKAHLKKKEK